jgi:hypothetical protein
VSVPVTGPTGELAELWEWFGHHQFRGYSPLYEQIATAVAHDDEVLEFVRESPPAAHLPPVLLGAVHYLLLGGLDHPLGDVYAGRSHADAGPLFLQCAATTGASWPGYWPPAGCRPTTVVAARCSVPD